MTLDDDSLAPTLVMTRFGSGKALGDRYLINTEIGAHQTFAPFHVYEASDMQTGWAVALKVLSLRAEAQMNAIDKIYARFEREIKIMKALNHPGIVPILDIGRDKRWYWMVMPYYANGSLMDYIKQRGYTPMPVAESCAYTIRIARALAIAHAMTPPVVHRDIKPHNMLFDNSGDLLLTDFGIAHVMFGEHLTRADQAVGTLECMAPEQMQGRVSDDEELIDARTDIYQLGCSIYWMLRGRPPFHGSTPFAVQQAHLRVQPTPLHELNPHVNKWLAHVVGKALAKYPDDRWQSMDEFADALAPFVE